MAEEVEPLAFEFAEEPLGPAPPGVVEAGAEVVVVRPDGIEMEVTNGDDRPACWWCGWWWWWRWTGVKW